jgi:hypothetical protein
VILTPGRGSPSAVTFPVTVEVAIVCAIAPVAASKTTKNATVAVLIDTLLILIHPSSLKMKLRLKIYTLLRS